MTAAAESPQATAPAIPVYRHGQAPAHLRTVTRLAAIRLQPAPGQRPVCYVIPYYHPGERRALYEPADAAPILRSLGDQWAWQARRTCPQCGEVREQVLNGRVCGHCRLAGEVARKALDARTCGECRRVGRKPYPRVKRLPNTYYDLPMCRACRAEYSRRLDAQVAQYVMCPGACGTRTQTRAQVLAAMTAHRSALKRCGPCEATRKAEQDERAAKNRAEREERERREREARESEVAELRAWAAAALADPDAVILDTETTGLHDEARIVDIAVTTVGGQTLLDTLANPGEPIPPSATAIHGITDAMVAGAPTFARILPDLAAALFGRRVLIYNDAFDLARLRHELALLGADVYEFTAAARWEDAMAPYSDWCGDWSEWHGNYRWQSLNGGHRALGDCLAVIDCLRAMARTVGDADEEAA
jgi:exonuclease